MDYPDDNDIRAVELFSLQAIYPDELTIDSNDKYTFSLTVPVNPAETVTMTLPGGGGIENGPDATTGRNAAADAEAGDAKAKDNEDVETRQLAYMPSLHILVSLPPGYPETEPPSVAISSKPLWLPEATTTQLEAQCTRLWEEIGRDQVIFNFVDHLRQEADNAFGLLDERGVLSVDAHLKLSMLEFDTKSKQDAFDGKTFSCGVCLDSKKGAVCHRMWDCGHVFCVQCLQDFYESAIQDDLSTVRCLEPNCSKERQKAMHESAMKNQNNNNNQNQRQRRQLKECLVSPGELLQIPLDESLVKRYVKLSYQRELEADKNTLYCPRQWCTGAARSKQHKKPDGLVLHESSGADGEEEADDDSNKNSQQKIDVRVCDTCDFAFCSGCLQSWHGYFVDCTPPDKDAISAEEQASLKYLDEHSTRCPTCDVPVSKTHGCNHMQCKRCNTHFCYLCAAWLDPFNPYQHYSIDANGFNQGCANQLWVLVDGDNAPPENPGAQDGAGAGGRGGGGGGGGGGGRANANRAVRRPMANAAPLRVDVALEAPLVLRIDIERPPTPEAAPDADAEDDAGGRGRARGRGRGGRGRRPPAMHFLERDHVEELRRAFLNGGMDAFYRGLHNDLVQQLRDGFTPQQIRGYINRTLLPLADDDESAADINYVLGRAVAAFEREARPRGRPQIAGYA